MILDPKRKPTDKIELQRVGTLRGVVRVKRGTELSGMLYASASRSDGNGGGGAKAGPDGRFEMADLRPGVYTVSASSTTTEGLKLVCPNPPTAYIEPEGVVEATVELEEGVRVRGVFVDAKTGKPFEGGQTVYLSRSGRSGQPVKVKEDGSWEVYLAEGDYEARYYLEGGAWQVHSETIHVEKGKPVKEVRIEAKSQ